MNQETLEFSHNWNGRRGSEFGKLNCACFTTIRLWHQRYRIGNRFTILLKGKVKGEAEVVSVKVFKVGELQEHEAYLDTGYSASETHDIMRKMWKAKAIDGTFALITLKWVDVEMLTVDEHFLIEEVYRRRAELAQMVIDQTRTGVRMNIEQKVRECLECEDKLESLMLERRAR